MVSRKDEFAIDFEAKDVYWTWFAEWHLSWKSGNPQSPSKILHHRPSKLAVVSHKGLPVSPILFLLAMEEALRLSTGRFGYADEIALFASGFSLVKCARKLQEKLDSTIAWGFKNGISFELPKTKLQYFYRKRGSSLETTLNIGETTTTPNYHTCWLGIFFDRTLRFQFHTLQACRKSLAITSHLKRLSTTTRGISPLFQRQPLQGAAFVTLSTRPRPGTPKRHLKRQSRDSNPGSTTQLGQPSQSIVQHQ